MFGWVMLGLVWVGCAALMYSSVRENVVVKPMKDHGQELTGVKRQLTLAVIEGLAVAVSLISAPVALVQWLRNGSSE
ncbi:MAG: hypothetical protein CMK74_05965 [Pseudomonadales bacterium]|nr:hypothetical protein [Pseudomonadales bacterium]|tara:strand:+ start:547 stop:777 length:231 start_codon:yes stop_codon:yes gene_type:complete